MPFEARRIRTRQAVVVRVGGGRGPSGTYLRTATPVAVLPPTDAFSRCSGLTTGANFWRLLHPDAPLGKDPVGFVNRRSGVQMAKMAQNFKALRRVGLVGLGRNV